MVSTAAVVGGSVAGALVVVGGFLIALVIYCVRRRRRERAKACSGLDLAYTTHHNMQLNGRPTKDDNTYAFIRDSWKPPAAAAIPARTSTMSVNIYSDVSELQTWTRPESGHYSSVDELNPITPKPPLTARSAAFGFTNHGGPDGDPGYSNPHLETTPYSNPHIGSSRYSNHSMEPSSYSNSHMEDSRPVFSIASGRAASSPAGLTGTAALSHEAGLSVHELYAQPDMQAKHQAATRTSATVMVDNDVYNM